MQEDILGGGQPLISYLRYDVSFEAKWMKTNLNIDIKAMQIEPTDLAALDNPNNVKLLFDIGEKAALVQIKPTHFPVGFDLN